MIGLVGSGEMGTDIVTQAAIADGVDGQRSRTLIQRALTRRSPSRGAPGIASDRRAMTLTSPSKAVHRVTSSDMLVQSGLIDVVVDATGVPAVGAEIGLKAMENGKHLVMMNVEADVTIGAYSQRGRPAGRLQPWCWR